ncbi:MAG: BamA/TamA family outer membrane protein [Myxococcales bacterium]|nr:BamA/TamA family outer membrane protein [Myxococcales bacterium]
MARSRLCLTVLALGACARAPSHRPGDEWLKAIKFEGNKRLGDSTLVTGLALHRTQKRGRAPDPYQVQVDADRIRGEYLRRGYLDVDVRSRTDRQGDATTVIYSVEEGVRATTRVEIFGLPEDPELSVAKVRARLPLEEGAPFEYATYDLAKDALKNVVEDAGYAHVRLDAQVVADRANHTAIVQLVYDPGPKCTFGAIEIHGVDGELRSAVEHRLQFAPGQVYSAAAIAKTQRALYSLGRFSTVRVQPDKAAGAVVAVKVDVAESARHEVKLGVGFGVDPASYEVRGRAGYSVAGWPFPLDTASVDLRPAYALLRDGTTYEPRVRALAKLERQDLLWTYSRGEIEGGYNYLAVEAYTSYGPRVRLGFTTPLGSDKVQLRVGWGLERLEFRNINALIDEPLQMQLGLDHPQRIGEYEQSLSVDLRDHPIEPRFGGYAEVHVAEGTRYAGGAYAFVQVVPELRGYLPIGRAVIAARVRTGRFFGDVPATERFFAGGSVSQRGFSERKLAPSALGLVDGEQRSVPYGGTAMVDSGIEVRVPFTSLRRMPLGGVVFLDGADVTETAADLDLGNLHWAVGAGLRLQTLVGPVRLDIGYRLNRKDPTEPEPHSTFAFHLSLGEAF